ncbi:hypothetical protein MJD09_21865 [bacterium]|nr:hypothetical protein [bacterium]
MHPELVERRRVYVPSAKIANRIGRKPFAIATFFCIALFPIAVILATNLSIPIIISRLA